MECFIRLNCFIYIYCIIATAGVYGTDSYGKVPVNKMFNEMTTATANKFKAKIFYTKTPLRSDEDGKTSAIIAATVTGLVNKMHCATPSICRGFESMVITGLVYP